MALTTPDTRPRSLPYVAALDGLRAVAVAAVLLYHGGVHGVPGGFLGVDVFFVLSGFLITSLLLAGRRPDGTIDLRGFWLRRARRLLPAAILVIAVCLVVVAAFYPAEAARTRGDALASLLYVNNWHQVLADRSYFAGFGRPPLLQHLWSLSVEEQFYLLWPLALGLGLSRIGRPWTMRATGVAALLSALAMALLFVPGHDASRVYYGTDTHASGLLIGALLAFAWPLGPLRTTPRRGAVAVLDAAAVVALAALIGAMATWHDYDTPVFRGGFLVAGLVTAVLVAAVVHPASRVAPLLGIAPARWIGQRSYGIYLWHWPVMALTRPGLDLAWSRWLLVPLQIAAAVGLAAASYRWVEQPIRRGRALERLKGWLDARRPRQRLGVAVAATAVVGLAGTWIAVRDSPPRDVAHLRGLNSAAARRAPTRAPVAQPPRRPLAIGASVMLGAQDALARRMRVDAAVGRQADDIVGRLDAYRAAGRLPSRVVVQIGENGPIPAGDLRELRHALRGVRRVVFVNVRVTRSWVAQTNAQLARLVRDWPQARLADWYDASAAPGLLYDDGTHPNPRGARVYAGLVRRALR
jgi:peptidoglycan/LPS O-acetylase OafA/YrhL